MALDARSHKPTAFLPQNTLVVQPKPMPANPSTLWALFWVVGLLMGLFARTIVDGPGEVELANAAGATGRAAWAEAQPTMEVHVRAVLELPSPTATPTVPPSATASPDAAGGVPFCSDAAPPDGLCRVPYPPPPTSTPFPSCTEMARLAPGDLCEWATPTPAVARTGQ
jgi:hypothetical protein